MEKDRINLLQKCSEDTNVIEVRACTDIFITILMGYVEKTMTGQVLKKKLTQDEYVRFMTGLVNSLLSSLYASAANNPKEIKERMDFIAKANSDLVVKFEQIKEEYGDIEVEKEMDA